MPAALIIRTIAIFLYFIAGMVGLKAMASLVANDSALNISAGWSYFTLTFCFVLLIITWSIDRKYCREMFGNSSDVD